MICLINKKNIKVVIICCMEKKKKKNAHQMRFQHATYIIIHSFNHVEIILWFIVTSHICKLQILYLFIYFFLINDQLLQ